MSSSVVFTPVVVQTGLMCLLAHVVLHVLFAYVLPTGPWSDLPSFTAHQVVAFPLMVYLAYEGCTAWFGIVEEDADAVQHILGIYDRGQNMGYMVFGMMLFWDIPVGLATPGLQEPLKIAHHVGLAFISGVVAGVFSNGKPVGSYYSLFFLGVVEFSTIFLVVVDVFHPQNKAWFNYIKGDGSFKQALRSINEVFRITFAITFLMVRAIYFPYVQVTGAIPDFYHVATLPAEEREYVSSLVLYGVCTFAALFSILQIYWGFLVSRQVLKALGFGGAKSAKKRKTV